jgi:Fic family protein
MTISERNLYIPNFARYPASVVRGIERIATARGAIERARILPAQEDLLRRDAKVGSVHYSNVIEGNDLSELEAMRAVEHDLDPTTKAKIELVNYVAALEWIDEQYAAGEIVYTPEFLKLLHGVLTRNVGRDANRFKPHHEGEWRDGEVIVRDAMTIYHVAPPHEQIDGLMRNRLEWLEIKRTSAEYFPPILAALGHFEVAEVHPFADYNGRAARLFAVAILIREGTMTRRLFSPERYYAENRDAYYAALRGIKTTHNYNAWIEYYMTGLAEEFERVAERVVELNAVTGAMESAVQLSRHQEKIVAALTVGGRRDITRAEVQALTSLGKTASYVELSQLVEAGVLEIVGGSSRTTYRLPSRLRPARGTGRRSERRGPRPRWTENRIRSELTSFAAELGRMPRRSDFEAAGRTGLYIAASKAGGLRKWAAELGY